MSSTVAPKRAEQTIPLRELNSDKSEQKSTETKLRELSVRLIAVQDQERRRIARELHDCTGQTIALLKMNLDRLRAIRKTQSRASGADIRECGSGRSDVDTGSDDFLSAPSAAVG